ncbi:MAG: WYL domain-containing transcriptional regulator [Gammaproteobacteria bacterium]|nr:WYL domain-containing transcriptional regulator [Gammaproteobacteria bacterium]
MDKLDRIQKLYQLFMSHRYPISLRTLASKLDCTEKSARRLIDVLQDFTLATIEYDEELKGWAYTCTPEEKNLLPGLWLTAEELQSMALLLHMLQGFGNGLLSDELKIVEKGIHKLLKARHISPEQLMNRIKVLPIGHSSVPNDIYLRVSDGLLRNRQLTIRYTDYKGDTTTRTVSPQDLVYYRDNWYLDAWCHKKRDIRQFVLARMEKVMLTETPAKAVSVAELEAHFARSYGIFAGKPTHIAKLRFSGNVAREVSRQNWHPQQQGHWDGEEYMLQFPYGDERELVRDILRYVPEVVVEGPEALKNSVLEQLQKGIERFQAS